MNRSLQVRQLHAGYGEIPILNGVDFSIDEGEIVGILGHNGMGKSTLLKTLIGQLRPTRGSLLFAGHDITRLPPHRRQRLGLGYVPQGRMIFPELSVAENLQVASLGERNDSSILHYFPRLKPLLDRRGGALSGGEQQLLALARCLAGRPKLILLDEPTEGIQPSIIDEMIDLLATLRVERQLTLLLVEQNLAFLSALCKRILLLQKGELIGIVEHADSPAGRFNDHPLLQEYSGFGAT